MIFKNIKNNSVIRPLSQELLVWVVLFGIFIIGIATFISYSLMYSHSQHETLTYLRQYMFERKNHENQIFSNAHDCLMTFQNEFMKFYLSDIEFNEEDFWNLYYVDENGATRMKKKYFDGYFDATSGIPHGVSSFIGNNQPVDSPDLQRRLIIAYILVNQYGPAWWKTVGGLHVTYPENAITVYYPISPWGLNAKPDLRMNELGVISKTLQKNNPERNSVWTGLYYDETAGDWTITYEIPVDYKGRHLFNPSMDVKLEAIMERLLSEHPDGTYNFLIRDDGFLVAYPEAPTEEQKWKGLLSLDKINNPNITHMYHKINVAASKFADQANGKKHFEKILVIDDAEKNNYLISSFLNGPGWWFVMVYPKSLMASKAHQTSRIVLVLGVTIFTLYYLAIFIIINKKVRNPLNMLQTSIKLISEGSYSAVADHPERLPIDQKNEISQFSKSILKMSAKIRDVNVNLERIVESRTRELEAANNQLREQNLLDGLTKIHNRRSFDRDLEQVFQQAHAHVDIFSLMMADIDFFKKYNDSYGHTAGDNALQIVAKIISESIRSEDRVYRYGGEEFVVLFNNSSSESVSHVCERIFNAVRNYGIEHKESPHKIVTLSAGVVQFSSKFNTAIEMINAADHHLYTAKKDGRNQFVISEAEPFTSS